MHQAPPVALTLTCGGWWRAAQVALPALAAAVLTAWLAAWAAASLLWVPLAAALAAAAAWRTSVPQPVRLQWNGAQWSASGLQGEVDLMLDLGRWMLLRLRPDVGRARWLPVPLAEAGAAEQGLRAALYTRAAAPLQPRD